MELLILILLIICVVGIGVAIARQNQIRTIQSNAYEKDLNLLKEQLSNSVSSGFDHLGMSVNENLTKGREEFNRMHSQNRLEAQGFVTQTMDKIQAKMDTMGKGLGEISKVNDFMQLLFNPAARGRVGEVQLHGLLSDILAPNQYEQNFQPDPAQSFRVEFAIKMPTDLGETMYLPIDSKFPKDEYERLRNADSKEAIEQHAKMLASKIRDFAKTISKYIHPPRTTDMAVMYLPDGIYEWVASQADLVTRIRNEYHVVIGGPSTLWMTISFVSYFFRLAAINDKSREVWTLMTKVKKQMQKSVDVLDRALSYNTKVSDSLNELKTTRYNAMMRELKQVETAEDLLDDERDAA